MTTKQDILNAILNDLYDGDTHDLMTAVLNHFQDYHGLQQTYCGAKYCLHLARNESQLQWLKNFCAILELDEGSNDPDVFEVNDRVKVVGQDITGVVVHIFKNEIHKTVVVIRDDDADMWDDDGEAVGGLSYRPCELVHQATLPGTDSLEKGGK